LSSADGPQPVIGQAEQSGFDCVLLFPTAPERRLEESNDRGIQMKSITLLAVSAGILALTACNKSPNEQAAENVESNYGNAAENLEANTSNEASAIEANGDNASSEVKAAGENQAAAIKNEGKAKANEIRNQGNATTNSH
jgi:hypothetical protein